MHHCECLKLLWSVLGISTGPHLHFFREEGKKKKTCLETPFLTCIASFGRHDPYSSCNVCMDHVVQIKGIVKV